MTKNIYTSNPHIDLAKVLSPIWIIKSLLQYKELIISSAMREFHSTYRGTYLGLAWTVLSPLIMLTLFVGVFGYIFGGRFTPNPDETPADFALALFIGLSFYNCIAQTLGASPSQIIGNGIFVKSLSYPLEILTVISVLNILINMIVSLSLCLIAYMLIHGLPPISIICLPWYVMCIILICMGLSWFLSSIAVFIRDVPAITAPISMILMFVSGVFFPLTSIPASIRWIAGLNPLALIIDQARSCFLFGRWPDSLSMLLLLIVSLCIAVIGFAIFMKLKPAFADVM